MIVNSNREMLLSAVGQLGALKDELVFGGGGGTTELFITDSGAAELRTTKDVDAIIEAVSYTQHQMFADKLRGVGFRDDTSKNAPLCRWVKNDIILDVMPLDEDTLGFTNSWYRAAMETAEECEIASSAMIRVVTPPYFCATKLEAFEGRGGGDYFASHDLEDIIAVIDGREEIVEEIECAASDVRSYIAGKLKGWLKNDRFLDALPGHLGGSEEARGRTKVTLNRLEQIASFD